MFVFVVSLGRVHVFMVEVCLSKVFGILEKKTGQQKVCVFCICGCNDCQPCCVITVNKEPDLLSQRCTSVAAKSDPTICCCFTPTKICIYTVPLKQIYCNFPRTKVSHLNKKMKLTSSFKSHSTPPSSSLSVQTEAKHSLLLHGSAQTNALLSFVIQKPSLKKKVN